MERERLADALAGLRDLVGDAHVLTAAADTAPYLTDWRGRYKGEALCVVMPNIPVASGDYEGFGIVAPGSDADIALVRADPIGDVETDPAEAAAILQMISDYNEDDCVSTLALWDWLATMDGAHKKYESFRSAVASKKAEWATDPEDEDSATSKAERELAELQNATDHMAAALDGWPWGEDEEADYRAKVWQALMHSVLFYKREEVIHWRERRIRRDSTNDNLHRDRKSLVVEGCVAEAGFDFELGLDARSKVKVNYSYDLDPGQTNFLKAGEKIYVVRKGDVIDETWKIEGISDLELSLVYLPLHLSQTLSVGSAP